MMTVTLCGRQFIVEEHGAEVFEWAKTTNWEAAVFEFMTEHLTQEHTFLDIGAWIGTMSLHASGRCKRICAVEPDPVAFKVLDKNITHNQLNVQRYKAAIGGDDGTLRLGSQLLGASTTRANPSDGEGRIGVWQEDQTFEAFCFTLETFVDLAMIKLPLMIKIDVEGSEEQILKASLQWLIRNQPALALEAHPFWWNDKPATEDHIQQLCRAYTNSKLVENCWFFHN